MVVTWILLCSLRSQRRSSRRTVASRAPKGSSSKRTRGSTASARASATRCRCPPESWAGIALREVLQLNKLQQFADLGADFRLPWPLPPGLRAQPEGDIFKHAHVLEQRIVLEDKADAPFADLLGWKRRGRRTGPARCQGRRLPCRRSRATASSCQQPLGPSSETSSPVSTLRLTLSSALNWLKVLVIALTSMLMASSLLPRPAASLRGLALNDRLDNQE